MEIDETVMTMNPLPPHITVDDSSVAASKAHTEPSAPVDLPTPGTGLNNLDLYKDASGDLSICADRSLTVSAQGSIPTVTGGSLHHIVEDTAAWTESDHSGHSTHIIHGGISHSFNGFGPGAYSKYGTASQFHDHTTGSICNTFEQAQQSFKFYYASDSSLASNPAHSLDPNVTAGTTLGVNSITIVTDNAISSNGLTILDVFSNEEAQVTTVPSSSETQAPCNIILLVPVKKSAKMCPGSSNTPRGLCSIDWYTNNPRGTVAEFKVFYNNLQPAELKRYEDLAKENQPEKAGKS
ncbi:hypothetical protein BYT27DRAFT_7256803 [Phlegmacium glaucopus]|nr:hypothetical protein BYT27DRAFT_7256803 [Phlegmacium glaucopus]